MHNTGDQENAGWRRAERQEGSESERKKATSPMRQELKSEKGPKNVEWLVIHESNKEAPTWMLDEAVERISEGCEGEVEQKMESYLAEMRKLSWLSKEQLGNIEGGVRRAVEGKRKEK